MIISIFITITILLRLKGFEMDGTEIARGVQPIIKDLLGGSVSMLIRELLHMKEGLCGNDP